MQFTDKRIRIRRSGETRYKSVMITSLLQCLKKNFYFLSGRLEMYCNERIWTQFDVMFFEDNDS